LRMGIRKKMFLLILLAVAIVFVFGVGLGYFRGSLLLKDSIAEKFNGIAPTLAFAVSRMVDTEIETRTSDVSRLSWRRSVEKSNLKYASMDAASRDSYFWEMDEKWSSAAPGDSLYQEYLENEVSAGLREILREHKGTGEIFLTDKFGGLVASSGKTPDFYQADETWWQEAFRSGTGDIYVGDVEYDTSSGRWSMVIAFPIRDETGRVIGVCKSVTDIHTFLLPLENFRIGKSGRAVLTDERGNILFYPGTAPMSRRYEHFGAVRGMLEADKRGLVAVSAADKKKIFVSLPATINNPRLLERGVRWQLMIEQDYAEVFAPLKKLMRQSGTVSVLVLLIMSSIGFAFGGVFVVPLKKLHEATEKIAGGDMTYRIDLHTGDEIEDLAVSFNRMTQELRRTTVSRDALVAEIWERKKAEEALKQYTKHVERINKELDDFTYIVSHDLKEPLRSIDAFSKFIEEDYAHKLDDNGRNYLGRIRANTIRMQDLIEDLLEISRIGKRQDACEEVDADDLVREATLRLEYSIKEKNADIVLIDKLPRVFGDRVRLMQVFLNLISNAVKFNDKPQPRIEIGARPKGDFYEFAVKDNGPGIEERYLEKIFEIFQRLTKKEEHEGTGAGLTIAKKIVQKHKGRIWAESRVGEGAVFYFTLPRDKKFLVEKKKIGEILVGKKLVAEKDVDRALEEQASSG